MVAKFSYQNTDLGNTIVRLGAISGLTTSAVKGTVATSSIPFDDPTGTRVIEPFRVFEMDELSCSAPLAYMGFITSRSVGRTESYRTGAARRITSSLVDVNAVLSMKLITHSTFHYKRPAETDIERITWLLAQVLDTIPVFDNGLIDATNPVDLSAVDYTGQFPQSVLSDCANLSNKNFFIYNDPASSQISLAYFRSEDAGTLWPSTLSISNALADLSSTCFAPQMDTTGEYDPDLVYDGVFMPFGTKGDSVYVRASGRFLARDVVGPSANTSTRARALELAQRMLDNHDSEQSLVTCTLKIPASQVNLLMAGMGVNAKFTHLPGWETGQDVVVATRSIKQDEESTEFYNVEVTVGIPVLVNFQPGADDPANEDPTLPPFVPGGEGTPTYVQSEVLQSTGGTAPETITLPGAPTAGNFLGLYIGQVQSSASNSYTLPDGWSIDEVYVPPGDHAPSDFSQMVVASKISDGTETSVLVDWSGTGPLAIFYFEYTGAASWGGFATGQQAASATFTLPSVTPTSGLPTAVLAFLNWNPDYTVVSPLANTREFQGRGGWAARGSQSYSDTIVASASGSYDGTTSGSVGAETGYAAIVGWLQGGAGNEPAIGQPVAPESRTSDGSRVIYQTNYPYIPGSLVVKVNGVVLDNVEETDPDTGLFTLPAAPAVGAIITWTYNVADPAPTGANNPQAGSNPGGVPPGGGSFPGGDGTSRPPDQEYTPAETPDGIITVFTIVPYIAGQAFVYINGLIQRKDIDWSELDPAAGTFEFSSPPWTGAAITVKAMPVTAPPTGSGFGSPSLYGSGINADTKANLQNNATAVSHRFRSIGGVLDTVRWQQRGGAVYSAGTGGTYSVVVKADSGGVPSGSALATETYTPGNPGGDWTSYDEVTWATPATLVAGTLYHIVFTNTHGTPASNYVSVNELFMYSSSPIPAGQGRQPLFDDDDWAVLYGNVVQSRYTANMDLGYASGSHQGMGYIQNMTAQYGTLSGTANMVRELFTVSGANRTVVSCAVRVRRSSGTSPLILGLYLDSGDVLIEAVSIPAATVPISAAGSDNGGSVWAGARFLAPHVLASGTAYYLRLSCASGTTYTAAPIRKGTTEGFDGDTVFMDGAGEFTTNSGGTWTELYTFDTDPPDLQFQMGITT